MYDPQALNRYVYVKNNPLKYIDPTGHHPVLYFLFAKGIALASSWFGIQSATHTANWIESGFNAADQISDPYRFGNIVWSPALEINRLPIQIAIESLRYPDLVIDTFGVASGWDISSFHVDKYGDFKFSRADSGDRFLTGLLASNSVKYDIIGKYFGSTAAKNIGRLYDYAEAGVSIFSTYKKTNFDFNLDISPYKWDSSNSWYRGNSQNWWYRGSSWNKYGGYWRKW